MLVDSTTPFDADKVEMIRRQLSEGGLKIDANIVADRMINDQKALLGGEMFKSVHLNLVFSCL